MEIAREGLSKAPWNGGQPWSDAWQKFEVVKTLIESPCDCWCCKFTETQREQLKRDAVAKAADLSSVYSTEESNWIGAFAEVVFVLQYGWCSSKADHPNYCLRASIGLIVRLNRSDVRDRCVSGVLSGHFRPPLATGSSTDRRYRPWLCTPSIG
jgi:hypothetical protein